VAALALTPLRLEPRGTWDPARQYWGEDGEPLEDWAVPIVERGPRPEFEMEQVLPGDDPDDPDSDPIVEAAERMTAGDVGGAEEILMALLAVDLRCLDAHAHLGNAAFHSPLSFDAEKALRHYEVGVRIGELTLGAEFADVLPWSRLDNRPFLRCLHGYGLSLWRLGRRADALAVFQRMLWLNPSDNQGARALLRDCGAGLEWEEIHGTRP